MGTRTLTYFISDLHLGAGYIADAHKHEQMIVSWLRHIAPSAKELFLLGDVLDYWYEYKTVVPRGYVRFFGALAELADSGVKVTWLKGNHDIWIYDYLPNELGVEVLDGCVERVISGKRFVMEHGDGCGEGRRSYRRMRALFRNRMAQRLFSAIHPRWTVPFAHRWSSHSRATGEGACPELGEDHRLVKFARRFMRMNGHVDYFVFGHLHLMIEKELDEDSRLIVLGDGFRLMTYGVFDGDKFEIRELKNDLRLN